MISNDLVIQDSSRNHIINQYFEDKEVKQNRDFKVEFVEIGNIQNLSGYILIKHNAESLTISKKRKKRKEYYVEVIFAGLRQPTKNIKIDTYSVLCGFIKRFKISDMDICFDGLSELSINQNTIKMHYWLFKDYIEHIRDTRVEQTSFYINSPSSPTTDTDSYKKILVYDKYIKESKYKILEDELKNWKRIEFTVNVHFKFKGFILDDYIEDMLKVARNYFKINDFSDNYLNMQILLLNDKRTHRGKTL